MLFKFTQMLSCHQSHSVFFFPTQHCFPRPLDAYMWTSSLLLETAAWTPSCMWPAQFLHSSTRDIYTALALATTTTTTMHSSIVSQLKMGLWEIYTGQNFWVIGWVTPFLSRESVGHATSHSRIPPGHKSSSNSYKSLSHYCFTSQFLWLLTILSISLYNC